jgi:predicted O-linked N-acetylglucosamine transferase (SPINDLY family)
MSKLDDSLIKEIETDVSNQNFDIALSKLNPLISDDSSNPQAVYLLAKIAFLNGRLEAALTMIENLIQISGYEHDYIKLHEEINNKISEIELSNKFEEAYSKNEVFNILKYGYHVLKYQNAPLKTHMILSETLFSMGKAQLAHKHVSKALELAPDNKDLLDNVISYLHYIPDTDQDLILHYAEMIKSRAYQDYQENKNHSFTHLALNPDRKVLRVGFVSGDFKSHALFLWIGNLFSKLKQYNLEVYCYCNNPEDHITPIWSRQATEWVNIMEMDDHTVAESIKTSKIDVLVDLSGHTTLNRLGIFALKPSPIQISWLGQSGPIGVEGIDYIISDKNLLLEGEEKFYFEKIYQMPDFYSSFNIDEGCYLSRELKPSPYKKNDYVSFGCFNNMIKLNTECFKTWIKILKSIPDSRLHLKNHGLANKDIQTYVKKFFSKCGIDSSRLILEPASQTRGEYLNSYYEVDICLDPFPIGGCTTSIDALFIGVPIICLYGNKMPHRMTASILQNLNYSELISYNKEEYIQKAVELAHSKEQIDYYRASIRDTFLKSNITNSNKFAQDFSIALKQMWKEFIDARK